MPSFVPTCPLCGDEAIEIQRYGVFRAFSFGKLCPSCVARVRVDGTWKLRRAAANERRVEALVARWSELVVERHPRRVVLHGSIDGVSARIQLRLAPRDGTSERFILEVEVAAVRQVGSDILPAHLRSQLAHEPVCITRDRVAWMRVALRHAGPLDLVEALETMASRGSA